MRELWRSFRESLEGHHGPFPQITAGLIAVVVVYAVGSYLLSVTVGTDLHVLHDWWEALLRTLGL